MAKECNIYHKIFIEAHPELNLTSIEYPYCIHHKDFNHFNHDLDNLELITISEHVKLHSIGKNNPMAGKSLYSVWLEKFGKEIADEKQQQMIEKRSNSMKGKNKYERTNEMREKYRNAQKGNKNKRIKPTQEMVNDIKNNISRKEWLKKYNYSQAIWGKINNNLNFYDLLVNEIIQYS